jgi:hypothetical protein
MTLAVIQNQVAFCTELAVIKKGIPLYERVWNKSIIPIVKKVKAKSSKRSDLVALNFFSPNRKIVIEIAIQITSKRECMPT